MRLYGCHSALVDRPQPGAVYRVQEGWTTDGRRAMQEVRVLASVGTCGYDRSGADERCVQCGYAPHARAA